MIVQYSQKLKNCFPLLKRRNSCSAEVSSGAAKAWSALLSCCAIVLKAWFKSVLTGRISSSPTYQVYFITQSCFIGFGPSPQASHYLHLKVEMLPGAPRDNPVGVNVRPSRVREPFMLAKDNSGFSNLIHRPRRMEYIP